MLSIVFNATLCIDNFIELLMYQNFLGLNLLVLVALFN